MPRILLTGAMGFLGQYCSKKFIEEGYDLITTDNVPGANVVGDLTNEYFVNSLPQVDIVINCAAVQYITKKKPLCRTKYFFKNNVISAKLLSEKYRDISHFIHIGTSMMYRCENNDLTEITPFTGNGVYSQSKYDAQKFISNIKNSSTVIPCIIGGIGREGLFIPFVKMIKSFPVALIPGDGNKPIHMVHVEDLANLIFLIVQKKSFGYFNAASPDPLSIRNWVDIISNEIGRKNLSLASVPLKFLTALSFITGYRLLAKEQLLMLRSSHVLNTEKSIEIGWCPKYTNHDICVQIAKHILNN